MSFRGQKDSKTLVLRSDLYDVLSIILHSLLSCSNKVSRVVKDIDLKGKWWTQEMDGGDSVPDEAVAGTLSFSPTNGGELDLIGCFTPLSERIDSNSPDIIYGVSTEGEYMTLFGCTISRSSGNAPFTTENYRFTQIVKGGLVQQESEFWRCSFSFYNLDEWTQIARVTTPGDPIRSVGPAVSKSSIVDETDIILDIYEDISATTGNNIEKVFFSIYPNEPLTIDEYLSQYIRPLQNLVVLGLGEAVSPKFIDLYPERFGYPQPTYSFSYQSSNYHEPRNFNWGKMKFSLQDINFEKSIRRWFENYGEMERLHHHFFGTMYSNNMFVRLRFMSMIFALEEYHRRAFPDEQKIMNNELFHRMKGISLSRMPSVIAHERISNVFGSLGNEPSAKDRLKDITDKHEDMLPDSYDVDSNLSTIRDTRHTIAHSLNESLPGITVKKHEILLRVIALAVMLDIADVDPSKRKSILEKKHEEVGFITGP